MGYEVDIGPRIISQGGNVYAMWLEPPKVGATTRGRGFWVGRKPTGEDPSVDTPSAEGAEVLEQPEGKDEFDDDLDPVNALYAFGKTRGINKIAERDAKLLAESVFKGEPVHMLGRLRVHLVLGDPNLLSVTGLRKSLVYVKSLCRQALDVSEAEIVRDYATRLSEALDEVKESSEVLARAILTKPAEDREKPSKPYKQKKAQEVQADEKGKKQYKYPKKGNGKGPNSDGVAPKGMPSQADPTEPDITASSAIDPKAFAELLGVSVEHLAKLAHEKTLEQFQQFFLRMRKFADKHHLSPVFLGRIYEALVSPPPPPTPVPQGGAPQPMGGVPVAAKGCVVEFHPGRIRGEVAEIVKSLHSLKSVTVSDLGQAFARYYRWAPNLVEKNTLFALRNLERNGVVSVRKVEG